LRHRDRGVPPRESPAHLQGRARRPRWLAAGERGTTVHAARNSEGRRHAGRRGVLQRLRYDPAALALFEARQHARFLRLALARTHRVIARNPDVIVIVKRRAGVRKIRSTTVKVPWTGPKGGRHEGRGQVRLTVAGIRV